MRSFWLCFGLAIWVGLAGCTSTPEKKPETAVTAVEPQGEPAPEPVPTLPTGAATLETSTGNLRPARWQDLPGWGEDDLRQAWPAWLASCTRLAGKALWAGVCREARALDAQDSTQLRRWAERRLQPWQLVSDEGKTNGLITGYFEPLLSASRQQSTRYTQPIFGVPDDLIDVELSEVYPQLKGMRLRGRLQGKTLKPYFSRAAWEKQKAQRAEQALFWTDDAIALFFMEVQGSGQLQLEDGSRVRVSYANQNGWPYKSIGRWLMDNGALASGQASMQNIRRWGAENPKRLQEMLNQNPSLVFFRTVPATGSGPPGALAVALTPERSIAVDPRYIPLGAPVWLATTWPNESRPLQRLMLAQDTGGAIKGAVRADFYWGSGENAGNSAGRMSQSGRMWLLLPAGFSPK